MTQKKVAQTVIAKDFSQFKFKAKTLMNKVRCMENIGISLNAVYTK